MDAFLLGHGVYSFALFYRHDRDIKNTEAVRK